MIERDERINTNENGKSLPEADSKSEANDRDTDIEEDIEDGGCLCV